MAVDRNQSLIHLREHLDNEVKCHRRLLDLAETKQRHIVVGDMNAFTDLLKREQEPLSTMIRLRQTRERLLREVADIMGINRDGLRLSQILEQVTGHIKEELRTRIADLKSICEKLRDVNDSNMVLIRQSLSFVRDILGVLVGESPSDVYDRRGASAYARTSRGNLVNFSG